MTTVAAAILDVLARHGVRRAFGIPGVHNLPFWDAPAAEGVGILGVRHEQAATYACDGLYRATGEIGLAVLTSGPGAANAVTGFGEAVASGTPLIVLASEPSFALRSAQGARGLLHEMADQSGMFAAFEVPARSARSRQEAMASTVLAIRDAWGPPPTASYVGVPSDILREEWSAAIPHLPRLPAPSPDPQGLDDLIALVDASTRVVLWVGGGVVAAGAGRRVASLAEHLGAPILTTFAARGVVSGSPLLVDAPVHEPEARAILGEADLLLILGSSFDGMNTMNWGLPLPPRRAAVTLSAAIERTSDLDCLLACDVAVALDALLDARASSAARAPWADAGAVRPALDARLADDARTAEALAFVRAVDAGWPADGAVVCDMAVAGYWYAGYSRQPRARRLQVPIGWGTLGYAIPAAIGPASAGLPTLVVTGDGGATLGLGELATYVQHSLPVTVLVVDDGGYGMLRYDQKVMGHADRGVDLVGPEWLSLAGSFGITAERVADVDALAAALRRGREANGRGEPRLVVWSAALFPPRTTSPRWHDA